MGWAKKIMMEIQEHGDWPSNDLRDKYVCLNHFKDHGLNWMIKNKGQHGTCSYCGRKTTVRNMYSLCEDITWKVKMYFSDIDNAGLSLANGFYDDDSEIIPGYRRIGQYVAPVENTYFGSKYEMMSALKLITDDDDLNKDIENVFSTEEWISRDFYEEDKTQKLSIQWEKFVTAVKHHRRFTFLALPEYETILNGKESISDNILSNLQELISEQGLIKILPSSTKLYRARKVSDISKLYSFNDITSSPEEASYPNRMSPAGVSMFYGSFEKETAINECVGEETNNIIVGTFETAKDLTVVDFTIIPNDSFWLPNWQGIRFFNKFHSVITKPVDPNDKNLNQYVPTQVLTEFIRYMLKDAKGGSLDGMVYGSSKTKEKNIVLFCNQKDSVRYLKRDVQIEKYKSTKQWKLVPDYSGYFK